MEKPKLRAKTAVSGKIFNVVALLALLSSSLYLYLQWSALPSQVPIHYNVLGEPDRWGHKGFIVMPLMIGALLWIGLHTLEKYPHLHKYSGLTTRNVEQKYANSSMTVNFIKNEMLLFFSFASWNDVHVAKGYNSLLGVWELPLFLVVIFGTVAFSVVRSHRIR